MPKLRIPSPARVVVAASLLTVTCCQTPAPPPPPAPAPAPAPTPAPAPPPLPAPSSTAWVDRPQTAGDWSYGPGYGGTLAQFAAGGSTRFAIACDNQRNVLLIKPGARGPEMLVQAESAQRILTGTQANGALIARVSANDPLLDAMAITRGRFAIEVAGETGLYLPAWAEVTRVIEDCR